MDMNQLNRIAASLMRVRVIYCLIICSYMTDIFVSYLLCWNFIRLVSERTVEENILRKAQQKKLLGDLAIEEGNFTTAFFKDSALRELFGETVKGRGNDLRDMVAQEPKGLEDVAVSTKVWEAGLESVEEQTDVVAAKTSKAEANAELAEFDENVPLDTEITEGDDKTPAEDELEQLVAVLTPIEKFALKYLESNQDEATVEYLKAAEVCFRTPLTSDRSIMSSLGGNRTKQKRLGNGAHEESERG